MIQLRRNPHDPGHRSRDATPIWTVSLALGIVAGLVAAALALSASLADVAAMGSSLAATVAAVTCGLRPRSPAAASRTWGLAALACAVLAVERLLQPALVPVAVTDAFLVVGAGLLIAAIGSTATGPGARRGRLTLALDLLVAAATCLSVVWVALIGPALDRPPRELASAIVHAGVAVALLLAALAGAIRADRRSSPVSVTLAVAAGLIVVGDLVRAVSGEGRGGGVEALSAFASIAAFAGITARAISPTPLGSAARSGDAGDAIWRVLAPYPFAVVFVALAIHQVATGSHEVEQPMLLLGGVIVLGLVIVRQGLSLREWRLRSLHLSRQVDLDPLTGLLNHRTIHERLEQELAHGHAIGRPVGLALIDVDDFKAVNDRFGHQAGDRVLQTLSELLIAACRHSDSVGRYAGDEFLVIFPGLERDDARAVGQRILAAVVRWRRQLLPGASDDFGLSIGLAVSRARDMTGRQLVAIADAAMYDAKARGKNRLVVVDADTLVSEPPAQALPETHPFPRFEQMLSAD